MDGALQGTHKPGGIILVTILLLITVNSGCFGGDEPMYSSFEEAHDAVGTVAEPAEGPDELRLGLIEPEMPHNVSTGRLDVVVLLFDAAAEEPVEDATLTLEGWMPMHGHGTSPEMDPDHDGHGVYVGWTTLSMGGMWQLQFNATLQDGTTLPFVVEVHVMGEDGGMPGMHDGMHGGMGPEAPYDSYQEARDAPGDVFGPDAADSTYRLKLLEPAERSGVASSTTVSVLLFDNASDTPEPEAELALEPVFVATGNTSQAEDEAPVHAAHGIYMIDVELPEDGLWDLVFETELDGESLRWRIPLAVGDSSLPEDFEEEFSADFGPGEYEENHTFELAYPRVALVANVSVEGTLGLATGGLEALTVALLSPDATEVDSVEVEAGSHGLVEVQDVETTGTFTLNVTGQGGQASYTIDLSVDYDL